MGAMMNHYWYVEVLKKQVIMVKADSEDDAREKAINESNVEGIVRVVEEGDEC